MNHTPRQGIDGPVEQLSPAQKPAGVVRVLLVPNENRVPEVRPASRPGQPRQAQSPDQQPTGQQPSQVAQQIAQGNRVLTASEAEGEGDPANQGRDSNEVLDPEGGAPAQPLGNRQSEARPSILRPAPL